MQENIRTAMPEGAVETPLVGDDSTRRGLIAAGGVLGAFATASCCVLPLALTLAGASGAWMANLRAMAPYQPVFVAITLAMLGYGFYLAYWKPKPACATGACAAPVLPGGVVRAALWLAVLVVLLALAFPYWFPLVLPYLP